jgi:putative membrane protein
VVAPASEALVRSGLLSGGGDDHEIDDGIPQSDEYRSPVGVSFVSRPTVAQGLWIFLFLAFLAGLLWHTRRPFPLTTLSYVLILIHMIILMIGGHYTYAEVPLFDWLGEALDHQRNNYDKLGHFAQGFIPAIVAREVTVRHQVFTSTRWRSFFIVCFCLAFSAFYEFIEWWVALLSGEAAESFLGTQGYVWDTQSDMFLALLGALAALWLLGGWHDRQLRERGYI